jgi:hypothetical protein
MKEMEAFQQMSWATWTTGICSLFYRNYDYIASNERERSEWWIKRIWMEAFMI